MTTLEVTNLLAATAESIARLAERVKRMEERDAQIEALLREIKGDSAGRLGSDTTPRRLFRAPMHQHPTRQPMDTRKING